VLFRQPSSSNIGHTSYGCVAAFPNDACWEQLLYLAVTPDLSFGNFTQAACKVCVLHCRNIACQIAKFASQQHWPLKVCDCNCRCAAGGIPLQRQPHNAAKNQVLQTPKAARCICLCQPASCQITAELP
jgi:hypothetical protein